LSWWNKQKCCSPKHAERELTVKSEPTSKL
jgi:hypothetical protein